MGVQRNVGVESNSSRTLASEENKHSTGKTSA